MNLQEGVVYTTYPAMYGYICPSCGNIQYSLINEEFEKTVDTQERLREFSTEELKDEIKRRAQVKRQERESVPRCRNCEYAIQREIIPGVFYDCCSARTYKYKKLSIERNYVIKPYQKACDLYKRKTE